MLFYLYNDKDSIGLGLVKYSEGNKEKIEIHMYLILLINLNVKDWIEEKGLKRKDFLIVTFLTFSF